MICLTTGNLLYTFSAFVIEIENLVEILGNAPSWPIKQKIYSLPQIFTELYLHIPEEILLRNFPEF
jgi:hypothetical protein